MGLGRLARGLGLVAMIVLSGLSMSGFPRGDAIASGPVGPNGHAPVDTDYVYSLIDNTNVSTDLNDGKSWLVRYYRRLSGAAGNAQATNPAPCTLDASTGKNSAANGGTTSEDCWWEMMNAWRSEASHQPGMSADNLTDHIYHLGEVDSNPYVSNPDSKTAAQPGPQNALTLTIPGAVHPEQTIVIGEHQDGVSGSRFGSAYDDGQGAAVILAVARSMLQYWTTNHLWPARTIQFVLFDGEEEGLFGSFFYQANMMPIGAVNANDYVGAFNVDQNGFEYPARHLGTPDKPNQGPWYTNINEAPTSNFSFYHLANYPRLQSNQPAIADFHTETHNAVVSTFDELGQLYAGKPMPLADYAGNTAGLYPADCVIPAPTVPDSGVNCVNTFQDHADLQYLLDHDDTLGRTDQDPFIRCGIPAWGILGAYDSNAQEPFVGFPVQGLSYAGYDTAEDNVAWLNAIAAGRPAPPTGVDQSPANEIVPSKLGAEALRRALQFAGTLVLNEATDPQMAGVAPTPTDPIAYFIADRYSEKLNTVDTFTAITGPVSGDYTWQFDDGGAATGRVVTHAFTTTGVHTVSLTASAPSGTSSYSASVNVIDAVKANTPCGQVGNDLAFALAFSNSPAPVVPEVSWLPALLLAGSAAALAVVRRRRLPRSR